MAGRGHTLAVNSSGKLYAWGWNHYGQLGNSSTTNVSSPIQIGSLTDWAVVGGGSSASVAIKSDGTLWTWGKNNQGQLGLGDTIGRSSPVQVGALNDWADVWNDDEHTLAIKTDGTLWAWGRNLDGKLGLNTATTYYSSPVQVGALTNWKKAVAGREHSVAIKTDGTLWTWGDNTIGQLGTGASSSTNYSSPVQVGTGTDWSDISGGALCRHTIGVKG